MDIESKRWQDLENIVLNKSPFQPDMKGFSEQEYYDNFKTMKVLVIGAGGLGCEILKNLALSGFKDIHVVDMDTIDLTNLNRQFLFRYSDVGKGKAETAAKFIEQRVKGVKVTPYNKSIQQLYEDDPDFYSQFNIFIAGLDNVKARQWLNQLLHDMTEFDSQGNPVTGYYMIDGGTEGFSGQARVIQPFISNCYECTLAQLPKEESVQLCTIASVPRTPQHCVQWVMLLDHEGTWAHAHPDRKWDTDSYDDMNEIFQLAQKRAEKFNIKGLTYEQTCGVVKNIIPAIASTNAIIAGICCNEAFKIATNSSQVLNNRFSSYGHDGINGVNQVEQRDPNCPVCMKPELLIIDSTYTVEKLRAQLIETYKLIDPSITSNVTDLIAKVKAMRNPANLSKTIKEFLDAEEWNNNEIINVFDSNTAPRFDRKFILNLSDVMDEEEEEDDEE